MFLFGQGEHSGDIECVYTLSSFASTTLTRNVNFLTLLLQDGLECVHDLDLRLFCVVNGGRNFTLVKLLQFALTLLVRDEDFLIWSQVLFEHGLLLLLDSALRFDDLKLLFVSISDRLATRLMICNHYCLPYLFLLFVDAFDRGDLVFVSQASSLFDFLRSN